MALSKPSNQYSSLISWPVWPDITPTQIGEMAADARADHSTAASGASSARRAYMEVVAAEKGTFAEASSRAYTAHEAQWRELADGCQQEAADMTALGVMQEKLMNTVIGIDEEAHAALKAIEPKRTTDPAWYGAQQVMIVTKAAAEAQVAATAAAAEMMTFAAKAPLWGQPGGTQAGGSDHGRVKATPVDSTTQKGGGPGSSDHNSMAPADKNAEKAKELSSDEKKTDHAATQGNEKTEEGRGTKPQSADHAALEGKADKLTDAGSGTQPGVGSAAGQGLGQAASPLGAAGGGSQAGSGSGSGSGASGLGGMGRHGGASGLGNVGSAPKAPAGAASAPAGGGPVSDFAKGFTSGASAAGAPAAPAKPLLPAEGARAPMTSQMGALSSTAQGAAAQSTVSSAVNAGSSGAAVAPVGAMGGSASSGGGGGSGPLPPFGSDLKGAGGPSQAATPGTSGSAPPAGGTASQQGGTGAPAAMLSGATAAGAAGTRMAEKYSSVDLAPAQRLVWELLHSCGTDAWLTDWAVGIFEGRGGGTQLLFVTNEGQGFVPSPVVLPNSVLPAMTDPVLPTDFLRRWFGWQDVTRLMLEYGAVRAAAGDGALLGLATSGSTTAADRLDVPALFADINANPIAQNAPVAELANGRYHRLSSLDHELYKELKDLKDPRRATTQLTDRCRRLVTEEMYLPTCGHDAIGKLGMGQELSDRLISEVRQAHHDQVLLASTQRPGKGDYGPPGPHVATQSMYRGSWIAAQILEALVHMTAPVPDLPDAAYAVVAAERGAR
ncbi:hypothetical protein [Mycobacteroides chelonae]|nr:hypothetical protein [Mycobacteroides chelonae]